eukprot:m.5061 g.5061  ORF g.5061 m.5061 type:complete len:412 (+) comp4120_c0_seq1:248-1483(+)
MEHIHHLKEAALEYHEKPVPGKIGVKLLKSTVNPHDLTLAYSPGVAYPVLAIGEDKEKAYLYTSKGNTVAVISNGTAILGLGNLGHIASKPVMEGKCVLFKRFGNVDAVDVLVNSTNVDDIVKTCLLIGDTYGGINLEDIKAPECFEIEARVQEGLDIPVFHDDQHGTAIVTSAALLNALEIQGKSIETAKLVCIGGGAAGIACLRLIKSLGATDITLLDSSGVVYEGRERVNKYKAEFAIKDNGNRTLSDALKDADVFLGVAGPNLMTVDDLKLMAPKAIVFACSNPDPEISVEEALKARDDIIIATGRSDYPNQVNNVLCFPFLFRGALDVRAKCINNEMKIAAVNAIKDLAKEDIPQEVKDLYKIDFEFGREYILPTPLDPRLLKTVAEAVSRAAIETGVNRIVPSHL